MSPSTQKQKSLGKVEISIIRRDAPDRASTIYLLLQDDKPIELGAGRFALVWLASEGIDVPNSRLLALKFVRSSPESSVINSVARWRFFEEILKTSHHATAANDGLVEYFGFGTLAESPFDWQTLDAQRDDINGRSEYAFFSQSGYRRIVDQVRDSNKAILRDYFGSGPNAKLQGEFYAMPAAHGTLEDLLLMPHDWIGNQIYARADASARVSIDAFRNGDTKKHIASFARQFMTNVIEPSVNQSGLAILRNLKEPRLRNRIVLLLAFRISDALASLHSCKSEGEGFLAHRDLKLGNFLLVGTKVPDLTIAVADLGFVGGQESVAASSLTGALNAREAFVLPPGTFPFRAPEQIQPVYEVTCSAVQANEPTVELRTFTEVELEVGDWLESPDLLFGDSKQREKRTKIMDIAWTKDGLRAGRTAKCRLSSAVEFQGQVEARGSVIKAAAQHSDMFSLGAMIYFIVTGGGNPEMFWSRCVALAQESARSTLQCEVGEEVSIFDTCQALAIALCDDGGDLFQRDLHHLKREARRAKAEQSPSSDHAMGAHLKQWVQESVDDVTANLPSWGDKQREAKVLTESPTIKPLLDDLAGNRIPLPIMLIVLQCMLRGKADSFVKPPVGQTVPISLWPLEGQAASCASLCLTHIQYPSAAVDLTKWKSLGMEADAIFLALRTGGLPTADSKGVVVGAPPSK